MTPGQEVVLDDALRQLRLPAMVREWREHARQAKETGEGYTGFLFALASRELEQRQANQVQRRLREARFPLLKTLETTDLNKGPALDAVQMASDSRTSRNKLCLCHIVARPPVTIAAAVVRHTRKLLGGR